MTSRARSLRSRAPEKITVGDWLSCYREFFPTERKQATAEHDASMLRPYIEKNGSKSLQSVTPLMAQAWTLHHPGQVRYLRHAWDRALRMRIVDVNPWACVQMPPRTRPKREAPMVEQLDVILMAARRQGGWMLELADMVEVAAFTGLRRGGLITLRRSDVDMAGRRLTVTEKGGKIRTVVLAGRGRDAMASALARHPWTKTVFCTRPPLTPVSGNTVSSNWRKIRGDFDGPFHSLRHFAASWLLAQGVAREDIAVQLGHMDEAGRPYTELVDRVYAHPDHGQVLNRIEGVLG